ncbi:uncharacterized protein [Macrobrachium rosenbergii]|uniref:uncharacterized protein isoform X1 n=1 Tax=Macrobrachium rosenbergii TaxID=79674 RepID=UPI0034D4BBCF
MLPKYEASRKSPYKGLTITPQSRPTSRVYCILFAFFFGVLLITLGAVFYNVILIQPLGALHPIHVPPMPIACALIASGIFVVLLSVVVAWNHLFHSRCGLDDGDESLVDDLYFFAQDDVIDQLHQRPQDNPAV